MFSHKHTKPSLRVLLTAVALAAWSILGLSVAALADPPPHGHGGGGDEILTGTVYFTLGFQMHVMNPDGSGKTPLPIIGEAEPSEELHGGHRWFLQQREIPGEFYPDGDPRVEIFAVREDGDETFTVQLTDQPDLESFLATGRADTAGRWAVDGGVVDGQVSWAALRWDLAIGLPIEAGIYAAPIFFHADGNVLGLGAQPVSPLVDAGINTWDSDGDGNPDEFFPDVSSHDWAPDATAMVWVRSVDADGLLIADLLSDPVPSVLIAAGGLFPDWSPDGAKIVFDSPDGIETINPDGTGRTLLLEPKSGGGNLTNFVQFFGPAWSPTSSHFVYWRNQSKGGIFTNNVYRAVADGSKNTNLTKDTDDFARPIAWR